MFGAGAAANLAGPNCQRPPSPNDESAPSLRGNRVADLVVQRFSGLHPDNGSHLIVILQIATNSRPVDNNWIPIPSVIYPGQYLIVVVAATG